MKTYSTITGEKAREEEEVIVHTCSQKNIRANGVQHSVLIRAQGIYHETLKNTLKLGLINNHRRVCTICEFDMEKVRFTLRGLCNDSRQDREFTLEKDDINKPYFKGLSSSVIKWVRRPFKHR